MPHLGRSTDSVTLRFRRAPKFDSAIHYATSHIREVTLQLHGHTLITLAKVKVNRMFRRPSRGLLLSKFGLLTIGVIVLAACGSGAPVAGGPSPALATVPHTPGPPGPLVVAAPMAIATLPATAKKTAKPKPSSTHRQTASVSGPGGVVFGIADGSFPSLSTDQMAQQLGAMKAMGLTSIRVDVSWYNIQLDGPGSYNWTSMDTAVSAIQKRWSYGRPDH